MSYESIRIIILSEIQMLTTKNVSKHKSVNSKKCALRNEEEQKEQNPLMIIIHLFSYPLRHSNDKNGCKFQIWKYILFHSFV